MELEYLWAVLAVTVIIIFFKFGKSIPDHSNATEEDIISALNSGHKVRAIKYYRTVHGVGLKEAKDAVEKLASKT